MPIDVPQRFEAALQHFANAEWRESEAACREVISASPNHGAAVHLLGTIAHRAGYLGDAIALMERAIELEPHVAAYRSNLGVVLSADGRFDDAIATCEYALALDANMFDAHFNLGNALAAAGRHERAAEAFRRALALRFDLPHVHNNLGNALKEAGELTQAVGTYRQALFFRPDYAHARSNLANALEDMRRFAEALAEHRVAVDAAPASADIHSNLVASLALGTDADALREERDRWDARHAEPLTAFAAPHPNDRDPERVLRVGYLVPDPRIHPAGALLLPTLRARDAGAIHATVYAASPSSDAVSAALRQAADAWTGLAGVPDEAAAQRIRDDRIDVLVDLAGHDRGNRLTLFARRPAPVLLAHPGVVVSSACLDARIVATAEAAASQSSSDAASATDRLVTFRYCGALRRVGPAVADAWAAILRRLPGSRLVVADRAFRDPAVVEDFRRAFAIHDLAAERLELIASPTTVSDHSHLAVDLALDTFPTGDAAASAAAAAAGVPVLVPARSPVAGLVADTGRIELAAGSIEAYVSDAVALGRAVGEGRTSRPASAQPERDARQARALEAAYRDAWRAWCAAPRR